MCYFRPSKISYFSRFGPKHEKCLTGPEITHLGTGLANFITRYGMWTSASASRTPLALREFSLVSFDILGSPQPLPPGLGDLPLYPDNDGFRSVNGPRDFTAPPLCSAVAPVSHDSTSMIEASVTVISGPSDKKPSISANYSQSFLDDIISRSVTCPTTLDPPTSRIILFFLTIL